MPHHVRLLGAFDVTTTKAFQPAPVYRPRAVALLSWLLLSRRPGRRLELAALLWPEVDEKRARGSLNQLMVEMRRQYGADAFVADIRDTIRLADDAFTCDAVEFAGMALDGRYAEALALYGGPLMDGFRCEGADGFNDWMDRERVRIQETAADCAWKIAMATPAGRDCVEALRVVATYRPNDEAVLRARLTAVARVSGAAEAMSLYEAHRKRIAEELSIAPALETRKLVIELCYKANESESAVVPRASAALVENEMRADPGLRTAVSTPKQHRWFTIAACVAAAAAILLVIRPFANTATPKDNRIVDVALSFGDQQPPAIRALPGLVATYLIRDTSIDIADGASNSATYQVIADLHSDDDELYGTVQIKSGNNLISSTALRTSTRVGMDTVAAQLARYVEEVVSPVEHYSSPGRAVGAARQHLLFARADYARGVRQNAAFELEKATQQLDSVARAARDGEWNALSAAVARERDWQARGE